MKKILFLLLVSFFLSPSNLVSQDSTNVTSFAEVNEQLKKLKNVVALQQQTIDNLLNTITVSADKRVSLFSQKAPRYPLDIEADGDSIPQLGIWATNNIARVDLYHSNGNGGNRAWSIRANGGDYAGRGELRFLSADSNDNKPNTTRMTLTTSGLNVKGGLTATEAAIGQSAGIYSYYRSGLSRDSWHEIAAARIRSGFLVLVSLNWSQNGNSSAVASFLCFNNHSDYGGSNRCERQEFMTNSSGTQFTNIELGFNASKESSTFRLKASHNSGYSYHARLLVFRI